MIRAAAIAIGLALLAGCGGGDLGFDTTPTPASTPSPSPTATADNSLLVSCPGFTPTVEIVNDTPYVILAAPCTPTPKP